jgi:hypothetical protein
MGARIACLVLISLTAHSALTPPYPAAAGINVSGPGGDAKTPSNKHASWAGNRNRRHHLVGEGSRPDRRVGGVGTRTRSRGVATDVETTDQITHFTHRLSGLPNDRHRSHCAWE